MGILTKWTDNQGFVILGWLAPGVLYARFENAITDTLGFHIARRLTALIGDQVRVHYFCDHSRIKSFDVKAYAAVVDALLVMRDQFKLIVAHTGAIPLSARTRSLPAAIGCFEFVHSDAEFELRLRSAAAGQDIEALTTLVDIQAPVEVTVGLDAASTLLAPASVPPGDRLVDAHGNVFIGWLSDSVLYSRFERTISEDLAERFARRFADLVTGRAEIEYFSDSSRVASYDLRAFSRTVAAMLEHQEQFVSIVISPWAGIFASGDRELPDAFGCLEYVPSEAEFQQRLRVAIGGVARPSVPFAEVAETLDGGVPTPRTFESGAAASAGAAPVQVVVPVPAPIAAH